MLKYGSFVANGTAGGRCGVDCEKRKGVKTKAAAKKLKGLGIRATRGRRSEFLIKMANPV
jgi:hypothetical protein